MSFETSFALRYEVVVFSCRKPARERFRKFARSDDWHAREIPTYTLHAPLTRLQTVKWNKMRKACPRQRRSGRNTDNTNIRRYRGFSIVKKRPIIDIAKSILLASFLEGRVWQAGRTDLFDSGMCRWRVYLAWPGSPISNTHQLAFLVLRKRAYCIRCKSILYLCVATIVLLNIF